MTTGTIGRTALAAILGLTATGAVAQNAAIPSPFEPYAGPPRVEERAIVPQKRPLTVMGLTGGIEPKDAQSTGSIGARPEHPQRLRLR